MAKQKQRIPLGDPLGQAFNNPFANLSRNGSLPTAPATDAATKSAPPQTPPLATTPPAEPAPLAKLLRPCRPWLRIERKGRGGKTVTLLGGLAELPADALQDLTARLKKGLGCGVSAQTEGDAQLLLQGDQTERARALLDELKR